MSRFPLANWSKAVPWFGPGRKNKSAQRHSGPLSRAVKPRRFLLQLEALEARDAPAVDVSVIGGVLTAQCDGGFNVVIVDHVFVTDQVGFASISDGSSTTVVFDSEYSSILIKGGSGGTTSNIHGNAKSLTVQNSSSPNQVNVGDAGRLSNIREGITIDDPSLSNTVLTVDDSADPNYQPTVTLETLRFDFISHGVISFDGGVPILYKYASTSAVYLHTGTGGAIVNLVANGSPTTVIEHGGVNHINVAGTGTVVKPVGTVAGILAPITINTSNFNTGVQVDDLADPTYRTWTLDAVLIDGGSYGRVSFGGVPIEYKNAGAHIAVDTGLGGATVNVLATEVSTFVYDGGSNAKIHVGDAGLLDKIRAQITVNGGRGSSLLTVDDSSDPTFRNVTLGKTFPFSQHYFQISIDEVSVYYKEGGGKIAVDTGTGGAKVNVSVNAEDTTLTGHGPNTTVNVGTPSHLDLNDPLHPITINNSGSFTAITVDDTAETSSSFPRLDTGTNSDGYSDITLSADYGTKDIYYKPAETSALALYTGTHLVEARVVVSDNAVPTTLTGQGPNTTVEVRIAAHLDNRILTPITINNVSGLTAVTVDDRFDPAFRTATLDTLSIDGANYGRISFGGVPVLYKYADTSAVTLRTGSGGATVNVLATGAPTALIGNAAGANTLVGSGSANTWSVTGSNAGRLSSADAVVSFAGFQNLTGGAAGNTFVFSNGQGVSGTITGGSGTNTLNYAAYTSNVIVNLQAASATGVGGSIANIRNVTGGNGGPAGSYNILVGNGGNVLTGGNYRRNLLIAGASASKLIGGNNDDILIGGTTMYDTEADMASFQAVMAYWTGADDYVTRVNNLTNGIGVPLLDATTVRPNDRGNTLQGGDGLDLFFGSLALDNHDKQDGEVFIEV